MPILLRDSLRVLRADLGVLRRLRCRAVAPSARRVVSRNLSHPDDSFSTRNLIIGPVSVQEATPARRGFNGDS